MVKFKQACYKINASILALALACFSSTSCAENRASKTQVIKKEKLLQLVNNNEDLQQVVYLSASLKLNATFSGTAKGNATVQLGNLFLRIFDQHDDGIIYPNNSLELGLVDINNDGVKELILTGLVATTNDNDEISSLEHTTHLFQYSEEQEKFITLFSAGSMAPIL